MKRAFTLTIIAMSLLVTACTGKGDPKERSAGPLAIDNALTSDEIAAGRLTPEIMWKMGRIYFGASLDYGYDLRSFPLSVSLNWSNITRNVGFYFQAGYMF